MAARGRFTSPKPATWSAPNRTAIRSTGTRSLAREGAVGVLATAAFAMGPDGAAWLARQDDVEAMVIDAGEQVLIHQEELSDRVLGVAAAYLVYAGLVPAAGSSSRITPGSVPNARAISRRRCSP